MGSNTRDRDRVNAATTTTTTQACAACKYQRRKCAPDCILAPYFPHDRQRHFLNAHKLFGVSNITKIIRNLPPPDKDEAMRTIIFQSDVRAADPVGGCYRIIRDLQRQIDFTRAELHLVLQHLTLCRAQAAAAAAVDDSSPAPPLNCDPMTAYDPIGIYHDLEQPHEEEYFLHENESNHHHVVVPLQDIASWAMQDTASSSSLHDKQSFVNECGDHYKPTILDIGGERLELKFDHEEEEAIEQSDDAISKEDKAILKDEIASFTSKDDKAALLREDIVSVEDARKENDKHTEFLYEKSMQNDVAMALLQL